MEGIKKSEEEKKAIEADDSQRVRQVDIFGSKFSKCFVSELLLILPLKHIFHRPYFKLI